jgi:hypothetical protein
MSIFKPLSPTGRNDVVGAAAISKSTEKRDEVSRFGPVFWRFWGLQIRNPGGLDPRQHWGFGQTKRAQNQV